SGLRGDRGFERTLAGLSRGGLLLRAPRVPQARATLRPDGRADSREIDLMDSKKKNLLVRIASALLLMPLVLILIWTGGTPFTILVAAAAALIARETYGMVGIDPLHPAALTGMVGAIVVVIAADDLASLWPAVVLVFALAPAVVFSLSTLWPPLGDLRRAAQSAAWITASVPYAGLLGALVAIRAHPQGLSWT